MSLLDDLKRFAGVKPRFPHTERDLAAGYGLAVDALREVRSAQLTRPAHWDLVKGLVCYNDAGKAALETALGIAQKNPAEPPTPPPAGAPPELPPPGDSAPNTPLQADAPKKFEAPAAGEVRTLVVVAIVRNRRILKARDQDRVAWVRVRNSAKFRPGMVVQGSFVAGEQWELVGRGPRFEGKF